MADNDDYGRLIVLDLAVECKHLTRDANPVCGLFSIDQNTGQLIFLTHTEVQRANSAPKFQRYLQCNYYPGKNQKLQFNIYSAPWKDSEVENSIHEEDRIGSVIIAMDKVVPVSALDIFAKQFAPINVELPLWHDTDDKMNEKLQKLGAQMKISFKCSEHQPEDTGPVGPKADQNVYQALAIMLAGADFLKYPWGSSGDPQKRFVWFDKEDGPMGTIYWSESSAKKKKKKDRRIPVHEITGLFEQNQTQAFRKWQNLPKERMNRCFSIVGKHRTLDLEAKSKDIVDAFMTGIHRVLAGSGFGVKQVTTEDDDELLSAPMVKNTFLIKVKLRNLPPMPWSKNEMNDTIINMEEKLPNEKNFKLIETTEWQKGNSNPNFEKEFNLPFTIPPTNHPVKFNVFDGEGSANHLMGSSVVRLDFIFRYIGQELMVKLRNAHDPKIDTLLTGANTYMLLTAEAAQPIPGRTDGGGSRRSNFNQVIDEFTKRAPTDGTDVKPSTLRAFFTRSTLVFMNAGCAVTMWSDKIFSGPGMLYYRTMEPYGQLILCNEKSGDIDGLDSMGNPKDPLFCLPIEWISEVHQGIKPGQFKAVTRKIQEERCLTIFYRQDGGSTMTSLDLETRDKGTRDAWAVGLQEYVQFIQDGTDGAGDNEDLWSMMRGGRHRTGVTLGDGGDGEQVGNSLARKFKPDDLTNLGRSLLDDDDGEDCSSIDLFGKDPIRSKKHKHLHNPNDVTITGDGAPMAPPILGDGAPMAPPIMAPDMVMGAGAPPPPGAPPMLFAAPPKYTGPKMRHFHWEVIAPSDLDSADVTLWSLIKDDLDKEAHKMLEELFKVAESKAHEKKDGEDEDKGVRLLDSKRANNIEIVLKSFRMPNNALRDAILEVDTTILTPDKIQAILSMVPTLEEKKLLKQYLKAGKPVAKLGAAEQFALYMLEIPRIDTRLRLLLFQSKFDGIIHEMISQYNRLIKAGEMVKDSRPLQKVMETILSVGNKLNAGTRNTGAKAFKLSALDKINDTRSSDGKHTLLDFIVEYVDKNKKSRDEAFDEPDAKLIDQGSLNALPSYLDSIALVRDAATIDWSALNTERETLLHGLQELSKEVEVMQTEETKAEDHFPAVMKQFLDHAMKWAKKMKKKYLDTQDLIEGLYEFFGENENTEPTDFFKLFDRFYMTYKGAELKRWQNRLRAKRERIRKELEANKPPSSTPPMKPQDGQMVPDLHSMMAARRASLDGGAVKAAIAGGVKSSDDESWEESPSEEKKTASFDPSHRFHESKQMETKIPSAVPVSGGSDASSASSSTSAPPVAETVAAGGGGSGS